MNRASRNIALVLIPLGLSCLGFQGCKGTQEEDFADYESSTQPTTRTSGSSGSRTHFFGYGSGARYYGSSSGSSSSSHSSSSVSRGGFGSSSHAVSSSS